MAEQPNIQEVIDFAKAKGFGISHVSGDELFAVRPLPPKTPGEVAAEKLVTIDSKTSSLWFHDSDRSGQVMLPSYTIEFQVQSIRGYVARAIDAAHAAGYARAKSDATNEVHKVWPVAMPAAVHELRERIARLGESKAAAKVEERA